MSLERLIKLAQKTGGTLIIQGNEKQRDVVVISVDEYELMADNQRDPFDFDFRHDDVRELSEGELLDRINRDIGIWRANKDQEEQHMREEMLGEDFPGEPEWYRAGDIIGDRYTDRYSDFGEDGFESEDKINFGAEDDELFKVEDIPFETGEKEKRYKVPFEPHAAPWNLEEHPLEDEEPIFFEEPIE